ncbi:MAG: hypothetical protein E7052_02280 [Lentisphaerae bacterium]|nr:hypothetical protein [Lentisphaerota bacterium]
MKKLFVAAMLLAFAIFPAAAENKLEVLEIKAPKEVAPGQQVAAHITLKVLEFEGKPHLRPGGYYNFAQSKHNGNIPRTQTTPWRLKDFKVGDILKYTAKITVPENVIAGEKGMIAFRMSQPGAKKFIKLVGSNKANFTVKAPEKVDLSSPVTLTDIPVACVPFTDEVITIDGKCDDPAWKKAAILPVNLNSASGKKADRSAELKITADGKYIYVAMVADAPDAAKLEVRKFPMHDSKVWLNDSLECFFVPDIYLNEYKHFITDMAGQHFDDDNGDYHGFNPVWKTASSRSSNSWTIEAAIPVDAITQNKITAGTLWRGGFFRYSERAHNNSGWTAAMGSHNSVSRYGYIFFGTLGDVLDKQSEFIKSVNDKSSPELIKLAKEVKALCNGSARKNAGELPGVLNQLTEMRKQFEKLEFSERFAKSKLPLIIQNVFPYSNNVAPDSKLQVSAVQQSFFPGEVQDLAWNLTNVSNKTITIHAGLFGVEADKFAHNRKSRDFLLQGIPGFPAQMFAPAPVAAFDGRCVYDVLAPNPAGVWRIAPQETVQIYLRVQADGSSKSGVGSLVIEGIDNGAMTVTALPVRFDLVGDTTLSQVTKPFVFGWDYIPEKFASQRPELVRNQYKMLREYGFNAVMLSGLRQFPRPQADKQGKLREKLDFTLLNNHLNRIGKDFDYIYWDLAIWEKKVLRKDLFGLDFYSDAYEKAFKSWFKACADALQAAGVPNEKVLVCPIDECSDKRAERIARWIKECRPESRVILDSSRTDMVQVKSIDRYVDVWMPNIRTLHQDALQEFHEFLNKKGAMKLLYYYSSGGNEKLKSPYTDYMLKFHAAFARDFSGIGFWAAGQYYGSPWYRRAYERVYDTALVYTVENGTIPSRRLAAWHRGVQDLWLLRETALRYQDNTEIQAKLRKAAQSAVDYPNDHQRTEALRKYCRELLASAQKKMISPEKNR